MVHVKFSVPGLPVAQPRHRVAVHAGKPSAYLPRTASGDAHPVIAFKDHARLLAHSAVASCRQWAEIHGGPIALDVTFVFPYKAKAKGGKKNAALLLESRQWMVGKPDADNLLKAVWDACRGVLFEDDCQVVCGTYRKIMAATGEQERVDVIAYAAGEDLLE